MIGSLYPELYFYWKVFSVWESLFTWIAITSWANWADKDSPSPLITEIVEDPSGSIISTKTEALNTGYKYKESNEYTNKKMKKTFWAMKLSWLKPVYQETTTVTVNKTTTVTVNKKLDHKIHLKKLMVFKNRS